MITKKTVDDIKARLDIVDVVSSRIDLKKTGGGYRSVCPFHDGKNMTMGVDQKKQFYHCFKCGAAGDLIEFIKRYDGVSFNMAVDTLCKQAGISKDTDDKQIIPKKVKDDLWMDSAILAIFEHDKKESIKVNYNDKKRVKLAEARLIGASDKYNI
jgi:DNA primase catalytic core